MLSKALPKWRSPHRLERIRLEKTAEPLMIVTLKRVPSTLVSKIQCPRSLPPLQCLNSRQPRRQQQPRQWMHHKFLLLIQSPIPSLQWPQSLQNLSQAIQLLQRNSIFKPFSWWFLENLSHILQQLKRRCLQWGVGQRWCQSGLKQPARSKHQSVFSRRQPVQSVSQTSQFGKFLEFSKIDEKMWNL